MLATVKRPDGDPGQVIGIYFYRNDAQPQYLVEHKDPTGTLYQTWLAEDELTEA